MGGDSINIVVEHVDGAASVAVYAEREGDEVIWGFAYGEDDGEVDAQEDSGAAPCVEDAAEDIARSLCAMGFETNHDLVMAGFEAEGWV